MNARCFPAAVITAATLAIWIRFAAPAAAQEPSTSSTPAAAAPVQLSSGTEDILKLSRAKISDDVTVAFVQNSDRHFNLTASDIVYLRKEGVSDRVLATMLNQSRTTSEPQSPPQPAVPAIASEVSAPEYVTPPTTTAFVETAPASTVYVAPSTPTYYSFYDPWPYWYDPWPYYYPFSTFGFYWGGRYNGYWNNYCYNGHPPPPPHNGKPPGHNGNPPPHNGNPPPPNGNPPPPNGNPRPPGGSSGNSGQPGTLASSGRLPGGVNQTPSRSGSSRVASRSASATPSGSPTRFWSNDGSQPAASSRSIQGSSPTSIRGRGASDRTETVRPNGNQAGAQFAGGSQHSSPTSVWSSSGGQRATSRPAVNQNAASVARPNPVRAEPSAVQSRSSSLPANRYVASPAASYQRSSVSPSYSYRAGGSVSGNSRPSMPSSLGNTGNSSAYRGGGRFSGAGAPRISSGGGFRGGGSSGGGGGRHR